MLNVHLRIAAGLLAIFTVTACGNHQKKMSLNKGAAGGQDTGSGWTKPFVGTGANSCFQVKVMADAIKQMPEELISVHVSDIDFVTKTEIAAPALTEAEKKAGKQQRPKRVRFQSASGDLDIVKIVNFLTPGAKLREVNKAKDLDLIKDFLAIDAQNGCASVFFTKETERSQTRQYMVDEGRSNEIKLLFGNTYRVYALYGGNQILLTEYTPVDAAGLDRCGTTLPDGAYVKRTYTLSKSRNRDRFNLSKSLTQMLRYVFPAPEFSSKPEILPADAKKGRAGQRRPGVGDALVSSTTYNYVLDLLKARPTAFPCSTTPLAKD